MSDGRKLDREQFLSRTRELVVKLTNSDLSPQELAEIKRKADAVARFLPKLPSELTLEQTRAIGFFERLMDAHDPRP
jgi:hypothetical protein